MLRLALICIAVSIAAAQEVAKVDLSNLERILGLPVREKRQCCSCEEVETTRVVEQWRTGPRPMMAGAVPACCPCRSETHSTIMTDGQGQTVRVTDTIQNKRLSPIEACRPCHSQPFGQTSDSAGLWEGTTLFKLEAGVCRANLKCNGFVEHKSGGRSHPVSYTNLVVRCMDGGSGGYFYGTSNDGQPNRIAQGLHCTSYMKSVSHSSSFDPDFARGG